MGMGRDTVIRPFDAKRIRGKTEILYSNYKVNTGLSDEIFKEKEPPGRSHPPPVTEVAEDYREMIFRDFLERMKFERRAKAEITETRQFSGD